MKKEEELIEKFKKLEDEIVDKLQNIKLDVDFSLDRKEVIKGLKNYVLKVRDVERLFEEYEAVANQLEKLTVEDNKQAVANAIVDMREDSEELKSQIKKLSQIETIDEIENINGNIIVKKKKKKTNERAKEM